MVEKHLTTNIGQYAIILKDKKMFILWPTEGPLWVLPGGRVNDYDITPDIALEREVVEETGLKVDIQEPFQVDMWDVKGKSHRYAIFFIAKLEDGKIKLSKEHKKAEWLSYDKLMENLMIDPKRARVGIDLINKLKEKGLL